MRKKTSRNQMHNTRPSSVIIMSERVNAETTATFACDVRQSETGIEMKAGTLGRKRARWVMTMHHLQWRIHTHTQTAFFLLSLFSRPCVLSILNSCHHYKPGKCIDVIWSLIVAPPFEPPCPCAIIALPHTDTDTYLFLAKRTEIIIKNICIAYLSIYLYICTAHIESVKL